ncbi:dual specificity protein phosphatase 14-like [Corticium candelabrum]|uniref:dual specificity protein phosphatase 14-like n=1 Tax=Corticium candelabrum TaxID=121492 RepID=UPI002E252A32|nr:dual specificity protein phosphatase 14-like [Corticium candelabrum]
MNVVCNVLDNFLFLGSAESLKKRNVLMEKSISLVINATVDVPHATVDSSQLQEVEFLRIPVTDKPDSLLSSHFDTVSDKIEEARLSGKNVLVHCRAGISRSSTLVLAYLMKHKEMTLLDAYRHVKSRRPFAQPKPNFWQQLMDFEKELFGKNSVTMEKFTRELTWEFLKKHSEAQTV